MMAAVLTTGSTVPCAHAGAVATQGESKLKVAGARVLTIQGIQGKSVSAACTTVPDTSKGNVKCTTVTAASGTSPKLKVAGRPVAVDSLTGTTNGTVGSTPQKLGTIAAEQTKLRA